MSLINPDFYILIGLPIIRNGLGWLQKAAEDKKFEWYEWRELVATTLLVGAPAFALYYGFELPAATAAAIPFIASYVITFLKKLFVKK